MEQSRVGAVDQGRAPTAHTLGNSADAWRPLASPPPPPIGSPALLKRRLTTADAVAAALSLSCGAGVWITTGTAAHQAGPAVVVSYVLAGLAALLAAQCYAEFAVAIPSAAGVYDYINASLGAALAWAAAAALLFSHAVANAAVARALAPSAAAAIGIPTAHLLLRVPLPTGCFHHTSGGGSSSGTFAELDPLAAALIAAACALQLTGAKRSAVVNNALNAAKLLAIVAVVAGGLSKGSAANLVPFAPSGAAGVLQGASTVFMSLSGFDVVANLAEEMRDPTRSLPVAIVGTQAAVTGAFATMALALVSAAPAASLDAAAPFGTALAAAGLPHAQALVGAGVLLSVLASVLVGVMCVARQALALARLGLLPAPLGRVARQSGAPWVAVLVTGAPTALLAAACNLPQLVQATNAGALVVMVTVAAALILYRHTQPCADKGAVAATPSNACAPASPPAADAAAALCAPALFGATAAAAGQAQHSSSGGALAVAWRAAEGSSRGAGGEDNVSCIVIVRRRDDGPPGAKACAKGEDSDAAARGQHWRRVFVAAALALVVTGAAGASAGLHAFKSAAVTAGGAAAWAVGTAALAAGPAAPQPPTGRYTAPCFPLTPCLAVLAACALAGGLCPAAFLQLGGFVCAALAVHALHQRAAGAGAEAEASRPLLPASGGGISS